MCTMLTVLWQPFDQSGWGEYGSACFLLFTKSIQVEIDGRPMRIDNLFGKVDSARSYRFQKKTNSALVGPCRALVVQLAPVELLARLAAMLPKPGSNAISYHGVFGSHAAWRREVVPSSPLYSDEGVNLDYPRDRHPKRRLRVEGGSAVGLRLFGSSGGDKMFHGLPGRRIRSGHAFGPAGPSPARHHPCALFTMPLWRVVVMRASWNRPRPLSIR
jgi:hypothetical protein